VIPGDSLKEVHPDEDQIGQAIHDKHFPWIKKYQNLLENEEPLIEEGEEQVAEETLLAQINLGLYDAWIKAGHLLMNVLTQDEKMDIILKYGNVAHVGAVYPTEVWRLDKKKSVLLHSSGDNFFELAEKIAI
jgi:hypothetical protein